MFLALKWGSGGWRGIGAECNGRRLHCYFCLYQRGLCWSSSSLPHTPVGSWCIMRLCTFNNTANYRELGVCERVNSGFLKAQQTRSDNDVENWWDLRGFLFPLKETGPQKKRAKVKAVYQIYEQALSYITNVRHEVLCSLIAGKWQKKQNFNQVAKVFRLLFMCYAVQQTPCCMIVCHVEMISWKNLDINMFKNFQVYPSNVILKTDINVLCIKNWYVSYHYLCPGWFNNHI